MWWQQCRCWQCHQPCALNGKLGPEPHPSSAGVAVLATGSPGDGFWVTVVFFFGVVLVADRIAGPAQLSCWSTSICESEAQGCWGVQTSAAVAACAVVRGQHPAHIPHGHGQWVQLAPLTTCVSNR
jgi:hypothetical protein